MKWDKDDERGNIFLSKKDTPQPPSSYHSGTNEMGLKELQQKSRAIVMNKREREKREREKGERE